MPIQPEKKAYKDWFDKAAAHAMSAQVSAVWPEFNKRRYHQLALADIDKLEFSARVKQFSDALAETLPSEYERAAGILVESMPEPLPDCDAVTDGWLQWPVGQFIADYGTDHFDISMHAMTELTTRFSSEFAVRPFVARYPKKTITHLKRLTTHSSPHVRRWCSEGTRTRLPWGQKLPKLIEQPELVLPILKKLRDDPELYVRKSVANNLNDLSKDHPEMITRLLAQWSRGANEHRCWLIKHALRGLVKAGNADALAILGYGEPDSVKADLKLSASKVSIGDSLLLKATISTDSDQPQPLMIDYIIHFAGKSGRGGSRADRSSGTNKPGRQKVFKWKTGVVERGKPLTIEKKHPFKTTAVRALYPGLHKVEVQLNGYRQGIREFSLTE